MKKIASCIIALAALVLIAIGCSYSSDVYHVYAVDENYHVYIVDKNNTEKKTLLFNYSRDNGFTFYKLELKGDKDTGWQVVPVLDNRGSQQVYDVSTMTDKDIEYIANLFDVSSNWHSEVSELTYLLETPANRQSSDATKKNFGFIRLSENESKVSDNTKKQNELSGIVFENNTVRSKFKQDLGTGFDLLAGVPNASCLFSDDSGIYEIWSINNKNYTILLKAQICGNDGKYFSILNIPGLASRPSSNILP